MPAETVRCVWCETGLVPDDAKPIKYVRAASLPDAENMQCKDDDGCRDRQDRLDAEQRARMEAAGMTSLFGYRPTAAADQEAAKAAGEN